MKILFILYEYIYRFIKLCDLYNYYKIVNFPIIINLF